MVIASASHGQYVRFLELMGSMFEQSIPLRGIRLYDDARTETTPYGLLLGVLENSYV